MKDKQMKHIIIGILGQVGRYVHTSLLKEGMVGSVYGVDIGGRSVEREYMSECVYGERFDEMHVCIPFLSAETYVKEVSYYMRTYPSKKVILHSRGVPLSVVEELSVGESYVVAKLPSLEIAV